MLRWLRQAGLRRERRKACAGSVAPALRRCLAEPLAGLREDWRACDLLVADLETTGLDPKSDHLVAIGWVPISRGRIELAGARRLIVSAPVSVHQSATVHGLRDQDVAQGVPLDRALVEFLAALGPRALVVHYAGLDKVLLDRLCRERLGAPLAVPLIDTLALALRALRHEETVQGDLRLARLRERFGLPAIGQHDALADAYATAEVFLVLATRLCAGQRQPLVDLLA